jgi:hypothetical protein
LTGQACAKATEEHKEKKAAAIIRRAGRKVSNFVMGTDQLQLIEEMNRQTGIQD